MLTCLYYVDIYSVLRPAVTKIAWASNAIDLHILVRKRTDFCKSNLVYTLMNEDICPLNRWIHYCVVGKLHK